MLGLVGNKMDDKTKLKCSGSVVDPKDVSIYEIKDGIVKGTIQDKNNLMSENYLDNSMKHLLDDFYQMLNYYD